MVNSKRLKPRVWLISSLLPLFLPASGQAQGTRADYERAGTLAARTRGKVFADRILPNWLTKGHRFWYRVDRAADRWEYKLVDAEKATSVPAFDHPALAKALARATSTAVDAHRLPIDTLKFNDDGLQLRLLSRGKTWTWNAAEGTLIEAIESLAPPLGSANRLPAPRPSRGGGAETSLTFQNLLQESVELFWIDPEGKRVRYATLEAGKRVEMRTFAGHVWLATGKNDAIRGVFVAAREPGTAVIDGNQPAEPQPRVNRIPRVVPGISPDGNWQILLRDHNLVIKSLKSLKSHFDDRVLTTDGAPEDFYSLDRLSWSPDSKRLVAMRTKRGGNRKLTLIESSPKDQTQPRIRTVDYLKPGDPVAQPKPHLFDIGTLKEIPVSDALFPNPYELDRIRWDRDSRRFTFVYNQRGHQVLRVVAVDANTGAANAIVDESSPTFIDYAHKQHLEYLEDTGELIWMSERDGWNHLYLYDARTGRVKNQITRGEWVVRGVTKVDRKARQIEFRASGMDADQDPYQIHYCRINFDGTGLVRLTEGDGTHTLLYSPDGAYYLDTWSRVDLPPVTELRRTRDGQRVMEVERADASELRTIVPAPERFSAKARDGKTEIYGVLYRPSNFDPAKKYPIIEDLYAGPQGSFVPKDFRAYYSPQSLAELGFLVAQIDGMGTSNRSKAFHDVCWKNLGDAGLPDRILWIKALAAKVPQIDLTRVGVHGVSAGGQSALRALLMHGDFYKVGVSACGCHDNRMDKIWWNELWMGWPIGPHYAEQSNVTQAHRLQGKLLLIVGELDDNVDPASTYQVADALINANKDFELITVPGAGHGYGGAYGMRRLQDFFVGAIQFWGS